MDRANKYDEPVFFEKYSHMPRSVAGLESAGEWNTLKAMLPDFAGKRVLDLGCGYGWHCAYAARQGAVAVVGIDISIKMLEKAVELSVESNIEYRNVSIEDYEYPLDSFDIVISSLAFHYIKSFDDICKNVAQCLIEGGDFIFSVEHPVFTAEGRQEWISDESGDLLYWPVDRYFYEDERTARFLDEDVTKYHRTLSAYVKSLLDHGFEITGLAEPAPPDEMLDMPGMRDELRRPMMLIISSRKRSYKGR
jgi:SAM-dependent methyltransferase